MNLVIVESPAKAATIGKYLGKDYEVVSSVGHIRDLSISGKGGLGVDVENNFEPKYVTVRGKGKLIKELKASAKKADHIYLATDPDREGEAISWHLFDSLKLEEESTDRIVFNEITKKAILSALENPRKINYNLVESQETRRILDRIIGFKLSSLLQNKIKSKSAGRVQSVALKLIVDLEDEITAFDPVEYWEIDAILPPKADLTKYKGKKVKLNNKEETDKVLNALSDSFEITDITSKQSIRRSKAPFITSTLAQEASRRLGFSSKKTMMLAQKLYEGIKLNGDMVGLITYTRSDSTRLNEDFIKEAKDYITTEYGKDYYKPFFSKKDDNAQDAHEAIRPTSLDRHPDRVKTYLDKDEFRLYQLIFQRTVAAMMKDAIYDDNKIILNNNDYQFEIAGKVLKEEGYLKVYTYDRVKDVELPNFKVGEVLIAEKVEAEQKFTKPPSRFTEASLIKKMEELGIGRPSTYAQTMDVIKKRNYVDLNEKKFIPTEKGMETSKRLGEFFINIINADYTREMEEKLDDIAQGDIKGVTTLRTFYDEFIPMVDYAYEHMEKKEPEKTGEKCPDCGSDLVKRDGRYGEFVACNSYPECKYIKKEKKEVVTTGITCPKCEKGEIVVRTATRGKNKGNQFYACNNFPKCKHIINDKPTGELCKECGSLMVSTENGDICSNKECITVKGV